MSGRGAVVAVAVALLAVPALAADGARKGGGSSSGSSRSGSSSSSSKSSSSSTKSSSSSTKSSSTKSGGRSSSVSSGRSTASRPPTTGAQRRHPRPGTGSGSFDVPNYGYNGGNYGGYYLKNYRGTPYPYYSSPFYGPGYGYGYGPYRYGYGFNPYSSYGYSPYSGSSTVIIGPGVTFGGGATGTEEEEEEPEEGIGSLRILVQPGKARVFVNGNYAGLVDDYDGILQRLRLPAGRQLVTLRLDGYRTQHFTVDVPADGTVNIEHKMVRGFGEEASDRYAGQPVGYARFEQEPEEENRYEALGGMGALRLAVRPNDASVYVDGEFLGAGTALSAVRLQPGRHRIEVVRPGYRTVERDVDVTPGETADIDVELERN